MTAGAAALRTAPTMTYAASVAALAEQTIRRYTDMLLHDMGSGLADNHRDSLANGSEWRTAPPRAFCMKVARATSRRRSSGTAARRPERCSASANFRAASAAT